MPSARASRQKQWLARLSADLQADVQDGGTDGDLSGEIGILRVALTRALAEIDDPVKLALTIAEVVETTRKTMLAQRTLSGDQAADVGDALTTVLTELGLAG